MPKVLFRFKVNQLIVMARWREDAFEAIEPRSVLICVLAPGAYLRVGTRQWRTVMAELPVKPEVMAKRKVRQTHRTLCNALKSL